MVLMDPELGSLRILGPWKLGNRRGWSKDGFNGSRFRIITDPWSLKIRKWTRMLKDGFNGSKARIITDPWFLEIRK